MYGLTLVATIVLFREPVITSGILSFGSPSDGAMLLSGAESLRDVIPFPKTQKGSDLMTDAPTKVLPEQLAELRVKVVE